MEPQAGHSPRIPVTWPAGPDNLAVKISSQSRHTIESLTFITDPLQSAPVDAVRAFPQHPPGGVPPEAAHVAREHGRLRETVRLGRPGPALRTRSHALPPFRSPAIGSLSPEGRLCRATGLQDAGPRAPSPRVRPPRLFRAGAPMPLPPGAAVRPRSPQLPGFRHERARWWHYDCAYAIQSQEKNAHTLRPRRAQRARARPRICRMLNDVFLQGLAVRAVQFGLTLNAEPEKTNGRKTVGQSLTSSPTTRPPCPRFPRRSPRP